MKRTREMRRLEKSYHAKKARTCSWEEPLEDQGDDYRASLIGKGINPKNLAHFYVNEVLTISVFKFPQVTMLGYRLNTQEKDIPWSVKNAIKAKIGYGDKWGFEAFPPEGCVVDGANMYWVFIPEEGATFVDVNFNNYNIFPKMCGGSRE